MNYVKLLDAIELESAKVYAKQGALIRWFRVYNIRKHAVKGETRLAQLKAVASRYNRLSMLHLKVRDRLYFNL